MRAPRHAWWHQACSARVACRKHSVSPPPGHVACRTYERAGKRTITQAHAARACRPAAVEEAMRTLSRIDIFVPFGARQGQEEKYTRSPARTRTAAGE